MRRHQDHYGHRAKREGFAARSIYKLEEIDRRWSILREGDYVVDLGCAPGSWLQYVGARIGQQGKAIGIDLAPVQISLPKNCKTRVGDIYLENFGSDKFDVVLSDMAPKTMGDHGTDAARSAGLAERALLIAQQQLKPNGHVVIKVLEGGEVPKLIKDMRVQYHKVELLRPEATRKQSTEIFLIGLRRRA